MNRVTVYNTPKFQVVSLGNGLAYEFLNKAAHRSVFVQGDDATIFDDDLTAYTDMPGPTDTNLTDLWCMYDDVSLPIH